MHTHVHLSLSICAPDVIARVVDGLQIIHDVISQQGNHIRES